jgi:hypothetical protein
MLRDSQLLFSPAFCCLYLTGRADLFWKYNTKATSACNAIPAYRKIGDSCNQRIGGHECSICIEGQTIVTIKNGKIANQMNSEEGYQNSPVNDISSFLPRVLAKVLVIQLISGYF